MQVGPNCRYASPCFCTFLVHAPPHDDSKDEQIEGATDGVTGAEAMEDCLGEDDIAEEDEDPTADAVRNLDIGWADGIDNIVPASRPGSGGVKQRAGT